MPILGQYGPGLLVECKNLIELAEELVSKWLAKYMFAGKPDVANIACKIAAYLSNHQEFKTHSRHIDREEAKRMGLLIEDLESDQDVQDLVLSVYHATTHTFSGTGAVKIIENHLGNAFVNIGALHLFLLSNHLHHRPIMCQNNSIRLQIILFIMYICYRE